MAAPIAPAPRRRRRTWIPAFLAALALAAGGAAAWNFLQPQDVTTAPVTRGEAVDAVYASGVVEYVRQARIAPVVTAPIRQVLVAEGDRVAAGQPLALLDGGPQEASALQLEAQAGLARAAARRTARLFAAGFAAAAANDDAQQQLKASEQAARAARVRLEDYRLKAPFAGQVIRREAEPGDLAAVASPLFVVADLTRVRITADVDERDIGRLEVGREALVRADAYPGETFKAVVTEITPQGTATGRVFRARLALPADTRLKPGMTVEANLIVSRRPGALLAPATALREGAVFVVRQGRAVRQAVRTGVQGTDRVEILAGVAEGEQLILEPGADLKDGTRVTPKAAGGR